MSRERDGVKQRRIREVIAEIGAQEKCAADDALMILGLRVVLASMTRIPACYEQLILKGGTALNLATGRSIGRVSIDLDLSLMDASKAFDPALILQEVPREISNVLAEYFHDSATIRISLKEDRTAPAYPELPKLYKFRLIAEADIGKAAPLRGDKRGFIVELTIDEYVEPELLSILDVKPYGLPIRLRMYSPLQAIAEKLRALLQKMQHFDRTGNEASFQPRHVLDLELLYDQLDQRDLPRLKALFDKKCDARLVPPQERTTGRMLHPILKKMVEADARRNSRSMRGWQRLEELAAIVCR
jgi:predicted nucleotidyltransferase component of viral defense system